MDVSLQNRLEGIADQLIDGNDAAHDFLHAKRVMSNALRIASTVQADVEVLIPAALFHDVVMYPKDDPRSDTATNESAETARSILSGLPDFPDEKIPAVVDAIESCYFSNTSQKLSIEALVLQDADRLEATGAIAVMRTFWSAGQMRQPLYHPSDPFAEHRTPNGLDYGLDLMFTRLLRVTERMNTTEGKRIAQEGSEFLRAFLNQFEAEWSSGHSDEISPIAQPE